MCCLDTHREFVRIHKMSQKHRLGDHINAAYFLRYKVMCTLSRSLPVEIHLSKLKF